VSAFTRAAEKELLRGVVPSARPLADCVSEANGVDHLERHGLNPEIHDFVIERIMRRTYHRSDISQV
jgi:hypothetical protein